MFRVSVLVFQDGLLKLLLGSHLCRQDCLEGYGQKGKGGESVSHGCVVE